MNDALTIHDLIHGLGGGLGLVGSILSGLCLWLVKRIVAHSDHQEAVHQWHGQRLVALETKLGISAPQFTGD
jgi:uncharacterized iron-regulated membrane protein